MIKRKIGCKLHTGSWINDDIDIIPTLKLNTGGKNSEDGTIKVTLTYLALCWLKWAFIVSLSKVEYKNS